MAGRSLKALRALAACGIGVFVTPAHAEPPAPRPAAAPAARAAVPLPWHVSTRSPRPLAGPADALHRLCGPAEESLTQVATRAASRQLAGDGPFGADELGFTLRAAGSPHVWPRAWSLAGPALDEADVERRVRAWLSASPVLGQRRCGVGRAESAGGAVVSVTTVDALADLEALPTVARTGAWVSLRARLLVPATDAKVVLLGPRGLPRTVLASLADGVVRASFSIDQPGPWLVQVLASVSVGPRPVLEAYVHADDAPPLAFSAAPAPGEAAGAGAPDDVTALRRMLDAARAAESLPGLRADPRLDALAAEHTEAMVAARTVGHDVGGGDWTARLTAAGVSAAFAGENVASASSLERAHRALWASPSHRTNLLDGRFTRVGLAVRRAADGRVWVTQLFTR